MCGIIGLVNFENSIDLAKNGLKIMKNRGTDFTNIIKYQNATFGHNLHSIIDFVTQPIISDKGILVINGEIYNWQDLAKENNLVVKNDSELVLKLIDKFGINKIEKVISLLDGVFAFSYFSKKNNVLILARDIIGEIPLVYYFENNKFAFASEKKAFNFKTQNLNPRKILYLKINKNNNLKISFKNFKIKKLKSKKIEKDLSNALENSIKKRIPNKEFALLLSGGMDSYLIGKLFKKSNLNFNSYFACIKDNNNNNNNPKDLDFAKIASKDLDSNLKINFVSLSKYEKELPKIISLIESTDPVRVGVASVLYFATKNIKERVVFSGLGADELFAGYNRFKNSNNVNKDCYSYLIKMYENDLYYQNIVCMNNKTELRLPFLDREFVSFSLSLNSKRKINKEKNKIFLREFLKNIGGKEIFYNREKKAAQYGSNFDKAIEILAKKNNFVSKADYLNSLNKTSYNKIDNIKNINVAALLSTGKDSLYSAYLMQKQGYDIKCFITIDSKNKDSFMFHTPTIKIAKLISKITNIPLLIVKTKGEKEKELIDLEKAVKKSIKNYKIEGVISGALYSNYQRERIERITEKLGIRSFSPLWHINQSEYLKVLIKNNFKFIITKIACYGLSEKWLGKEINEKDINELIKLEKKYGINVAGEGGEYETLLIDAPFFEKKVNVEFEKVMQNEFTGEIKIKKVELVKK